MNDVINCAVDGGNATIEVVIEGKKYPVIFPSLGADTSDINYNNAARVKDTSKVGYNKLHVEVTRNRVKSSEAREFIFGHMAEEYSKSKKNRENFDKSSDAELADWMITSLAFALFDTYKKQGIEKKQFRVNLGTGLPYHEAMNEEKKKKYGKMLHGNHLVKFLHPFFKNLEIELIIENVYIFVEGESALEFIIYDPEGEYMNAAPEELIGAMVNIVNIGAFSTELVTITFKQDTADEDFIDEFSLENDLTIKPETIAHLTKGIQKGVGSAIVDTINSIKINEPGIERELIRRDIEKAFTTAGRNTATNTFGWIYPEKVNIKPYFDKHIEEVATTIAKQIHGLYSAGNVKSQIRKIYLSGGGSRIDKMAEVIQNELEIAGYNKNNILCIADPLFVDVKGYYHALISCLEAEYEEQAI